jgi:hydrogenase nickel incorporation protein HypA/HybF
MHELGIAQSIFDAIQVEATRHPQARAKKVVVRIGELAAVNPDALKFAFEILTRDRELQSLELEIEICLRRQRCGACGAEFDVAGYELNCPKCGEQRTQCIGGDQLELAYVEMEELEVRQHEPSTD